VPKMAPCRDERRAAQPPVELELPPHWKRRQGKGSTSAPLARRQIIPLSTSSATLNPAGSSGEALDIAGAAGLTDAAHAVRDCDARRWGRSRAAVQLTTASLCVEIWHGSAGRGQVSSRADRRIRALRRPHHGRSSSYAGPPRPRTAAVVMARSGRTGTEWSRRRQGRDYAAVVAHLEGGLGVDQSAPIAEEGGSTCSSRSSPRASACQIGAKAP
jgi:hypothetical protein